MVLTTIPLVLLAEILESISNSSFFFSYTPLITRYQWLFSTNSNCPNQLMLVDFSVLVYCLAYSINNITIPGSPRSFHLPLYVTFCGWINLSKIQWGSLLCSKTFNNFFESRKHHTQKFLEEIQILWPNSTFFLLISTTWWYCLNPCSKTLPNCPFQPWCRFYLCTILAVPRLPVFPTRSYVSQVRITIILCASLSKITSPYLSSFIATVIQFYLPSKIPEFF